MRKGLALTAAAAVLAGAAATSHSGVVVDITPLGDPTSTGAGINNATAPAFDAFLVTLRTTTAGELIQSLDFTPASGMPTPGDRGFYIPGSGFLQRGVPDPGDPDAPPTLTPTATQRNNTTNLASLDSHFLVPAGNRVTVNEPTEDNNFVNPPGSPPDSAAANFGSGSFLTATFGLRGDVAGAQAATLDLAYIVQPDGAVSVYNGFVTTSEGTFPVSGVIPVPEPTALSLGVLAGAGLLGIRRRRA